MCKLYSANGRGGYPAETVFKYLLLQHVEDLSGRELERFLEENLAAKLFCGFSLREETPEHSYFSYLRTRIGTNNLAKLFNKVREGMKQRLINKIAITPANVTDQKGIKHVCPHGGMVLADKAYCSNEAQREMKRRGCHSGAILKNNMRAKNKDKNKWLVKLRMPYEGVFSKMNKRTNYKGTVKNQFNGFMDALAYNMKRLIKIEAPPIPIMGF